jgi:hypothetical protein
MAATDSNEGNSKMQFLNTSSYSDLDGDLSSSNQKPTGSGSKNETNKQTSTVINLGNSGGAQGSRSTQQEHISTLDEPVSVTISRDLKAIGHKFSHVFYPKQSTLLLRDWDLWGPLSLCVLLSISLQGDSNFSTNAPEFASVFALIALGAIVVTVNTKLLSGKISFFQSICALGYCLLPLVMVAWLSELLLWIGGNDSITGFVFRFLLVTVSCGWSVFASTAFLAADTINLEDKKSLAVYPIFLFYFVISWLIILDTH